MEAKELMVGDYVINTEFEKNDVDTIEAVEPSHVWLTHGKTYIPIGIPIGNIDPIPLTPETLEKIGFTVEEDPIYEECYVDEDAIEQTYTAKMKCVDVRKCDVEIKYKTYGNSIYVFSYDYHNILPSHRIDTQIEYVHELQHIMRLFGIEKEIIL